MYDVILSKAFSSITAVIKLEKSSGLPILKESTSSTIVFCTSGHMFFGIYALDAAEHFCPWNSKAPREIAVPTSFAFALGWAIIKSFPPVSPTILGYDLYSFILFYIGFCFRNYIVF